MLKLKQYFNRKSEFPQLSEEEQKEVYDSLKIKRRSKGSLKEIITKTITQFEEFPTDTVALRLSEDEEEDPYSTFKIHPDKPKKEENDDIYATFKIHDQSENDKDNQNDPYSTFKVSDVEQSDSFGTLKLSDSEDSNSSSQNGHLAWVRPPEDWELRILALERGEWVPEMANEGAFRRWKKERTKLRGSVFLSRANSDKIQMKSNNSLKRSIQKCGSVPTGNRSENLSLSNNSKSNFEHSEARLEDEHSSHQRSDSVGNRADSLQQLKERLAELGKRKLTLDLYSSLQTQPNGPSLSSSLESPRYKQSTEFKDFKDFRHIN